MRWWQWLLVLVVAAIVAMVMFRLPLVGAGVRVVGVESAADRAALNDALCRYDREMAASSDPYPLGDHDSFRLRHGADYFAFFLRMATTRGAINFRACLSARNVVGSGCGVLRQIPADWRRPSALDEAWYVCDLRVTPTRRGKRLPAQMLLGTLAASYWRCRRAFGITMETDPRGAVGRLAERVRPGPVHFTEACRLLLYSLDAKQMRAAAPYLVVERGPLCYRSLRGVKDLVLTSSGQAMPLLHVNFQRFDATLAPTKGDGRRLAEPLEGHTHMFCLPEADPLVVLLKQEAIRHGATARVLAHNMAGFDFAFVQTSEI